MRGEIQNRTRAKQLRDFTGLRFGNITPTDIDFFVEFHDRLFVWGEAKVTGAPLPAGQRKAIERACDAIAETGRVAVVFILEHDSPPDEDIDFAACQVREYRYDGAWHEPISPVNCRQAIEVMLERAGIPL